MTETDTGVRRVYIDIGEVINPGISPVDVTRRDGITQFTVHPGTPAPAGIEEIAQRVTAEELWPWASPWVDAAAVDLAELQTDPLRFLAREAPHILYLPTSPSVIPPQQRPPWRL